jgi:hypothetical protein
MFQNLSMDGNVYPMLEMLIKTTPDIGAIPLWEVRLKDHLNYATLSINQSIYSVLVYIVDAFVVKVFEELVLMSTMIHVS